MRTSTVITTLTHTYTHTNRHADTHTVTAFSLLIYYVFDSVLDVLYLSMNELEFFLLKPHENSLCVKRLEQIHDRIHLHVETNYILWFVFSVPIISNPVFCRCFKPMHYFPLDPFWPHASPHIFARCSLMCTARDMTWNELGSNGKRVRRSKYTGRLSQTSAPNAPDESA